jgi:hypothetical protein
MQLRSERAWDQEVHPQKRKEKISPMVDGRNKGDYDVQNAS